MTGDRFAPHRWLAVWLPFLPADALRRSWREAGVAPAEADACLVLTEKTRGALRLTAVSPEAMVAGLEPGLTLADARARIPHLVAIEHDPEVDACMLERLADECGRFSPAVSMDEGDGLLLDIAGCEHLFGGEKKLRERLGGRLRAIGFHARISIAASPEAARALSRFSRIGIVPPGAEADSVHPLPVAALGVPEETRIALVRAGLKTIGDIARRPSLPLSARFSEDVRRRLDRMLGREAAPVAHRQAGFLITVERRFPEPIGHAEDIEQTLTELVAEATARLVQRREGGRVFEAAFFRADGSVRRIVVETGQPTHDPKALMRLYRERLDTLADPLDPGFGFDAVQIAVLVAEPLAPVQDRLDGRSHEAVELAELVDRLSARFGENRVLRLACADTHDPDRASWSGPARGWSAAATDPAVVEHEDPPSRPLHVFASPQPIRTIAEAPDGPPWRFIWRGREHRILHAEGPERIAPEWWRAPPDAEMRDYFRVEDEDGRRFWVFRIGRYGASPPPRWYVHGLFA
jgi:protein ImuB